VPDKHQRVYSQQGSRANFRGVEHLFDRFEGGFRQRCADFRARAAHQFFFERFKDKPGDCLGGFEEDIASKAVRHRHIHFAGE